MANENTAVVGVPYEVWQRQQLAKELAEAPKLDEVQPGGVYRGTDGQLHDAEGNPVKRSKKAETEETEETEETDFSSMTLEDLKEEAAKRDLHVTRGDGKDGAPLKADYVKALEGAK